MQADQARAAATPVSATKTADGEPKEVIQLSPFQVSSDQDKGYSASSSMSGTLAGIENLLKSIEPDIEVFAA